MKSRERKKVEEDLVCVGLALVLGAYLHKGENIGVLAYCATC